MADERAVTLRLFVAVELPGDVRRALQGVIDALRTAGVDEGLRWVRPEGIHITLKFLGAVAEDRVPAMHTALRLAVRDASPFGLRPGGVGSFGGRRNLRVVWVGVGGDTDALAALAERVETSLAPLGFARESRPFAAHLTLARVRDETSAEARARIYEALSRFEAPVVPAMRVASVSLMRSTLGRGGAVYEAIGEYPLASALLL